MTIYGRPDELVTAESALAVEVLDFPDIPRGWGITFDQTGGLPPVEWMNGLFRRIDRAMRYVMQRGLPEWSATDDYPQGAYVQYTGNAYLSKRANSNKQPGTTGSSNDWGRGAVTRDQFDAGTTGRLINVRSLTSSGTAQKTPGAVSGLIRIWGGGGDGQASTTGASGSGGGGGGYIEWFGPLSLLSASPTSLAKQERLGRRVDNPVRPVGFLDWLNASGSSWRRRR